MTQIASMAGRMKLSGPRMVSDTAAAASPISAGMWHFVLCHCSTKITVNSEVMAKSMPVVSNGSMPPMIVPSTEPRIQ